MKIYSDNKLIAEGEKITMKITEPRKRNIDLSYSIQGYARKKNWKERMKQLQNSIK